MEIQYLSSRQNPLVKLVCGLADKKKRNELGLFRFDGTKLLYEALDSELNIKHVIFRETKAGEIPDVVKTALDRGRITVQDVICVSESVFDKLSDEKSPEGIITVACFLQELHRKIDDVVTLAGKKILIAESLRDPGNLGTVIRSCYALGIDTLVISDDCADIYNPRALRAAMGSIFKMATLTVSRNALAGTIKALRAEGREIYAAALAENSRDIGSVKLKEGDCFVIGNEGHGLSAQIVQACTAPVIIPMREGAESLNAAAAAAICIWETVRQR